MCFKNLPIELDSAGRARLRGDGEWGANGDGGAFSLAGAPSQAPGGTLVGSFPTWSLTDEGATGFEAPKPVELLFDPQERWFRLHRS